MNTSSFGSPGNCVFTSEMVPLIEVSDRDSDTQPKEPPLVTAASLLAYMRSRVVYYGSPLPEGFAVPPGIDLDSLLKQVPWPPPATE